MTFPSILGSMLVALLLGCATAREPARAPINQTNYHGWPDAIRLCNGTVELIVVPSIGGRIIRYGYVGGENFLWENEKLAGAAPSTQPYKNFGGDKAWPWPQDDWKRLIGGFWPPPVAFDQTSFDCEEIDALAMRLTSRVASEFGFKIVREVRLAPHGTRVTIESRLVPEPGAVTVVPAAPWHVTQMPLADLVLARVARDASEAPFRPLPPHAPATVERVGRDVLVLKRPDAMAAKIGMDADLLAWVKGSTFLIQRLQPVEGAPAHLPGERAQVFFQSTTGPQTYLELEFAAPRGGVAPTPLRVTWDLHDLPRDLKTPDAIATYLRALW
ncbi:MAG: hypothetical protein WBD40_02140 [Tepidisphaeraceae bacterium]